MDNNPNWKVMLFAAASGALIITLLGFLLLGWTPSSVAATQAEDAAEAAVIKVLAPICAIQFNADRNVESNLVTLAAQKDFSQGEFVKDGGWATMPGSEKPIEGVSKACADLVLGL